MELNFANADYYGQVHTQDDDTVIRQGKGVMKYHSGRIYEGNWLEDMREGEGYERFENNNVYKGRFKKGRAHGKGVYTWQTGEVYEGEWIKGKLGDSIIYRNSSLDLKSYHIPSNFIKYRS